MEGISLGNAASAARGRKGWFIGHFIEEDPLRQTGAVEVKWGLHEKDEKNEGGFVANQAATTLSVAIRGHFRLWFQEGDRTEQVELDSPGKYVLWSPGVPHDWQAVTECVVLTVRWPSISQDQEPHRAGRAPQGTGR